jgi:hypothetical protein
MMTVIHRYHVPALARARAAKEIRTKLLKFLGSESRMQREAGRSAVMRARPWVRAANLEFPHSREFLRFSREFGGAILARSNGLCTNISSRYVRVNPNR